jgi:site-specific recombinase XerD
VKQKINKAIAKRSGTELAEAESGIPRLISSAGDDAIERFVEFFTANIRNKNTRRAYLRNAVSFLRWCDKRGVKDLKLVKPVLVAAYVEQLQDTLSKPSVKQHLATIRMFFDWMVVGQVIPANPASSVRGPKHSVKKGKTPVLSADETRQLLDSIDVSTVVGLRDRAIIAVMVFSFARVGAMLAMKVEDYYAQGRRAWVRLHEKGGKQHEMPAHHNLEAYIDAYLKVAGIENEEKTPLFRSAKGKAGVLSENRLSQPDIWRMIRKRALQAGIKTRIGCHSFRATGITVYLENGGSLERAQTMANHESPRTTKLYDRTKDQITLDEVERIVI